MPLDIAGVRRQLIGQYSGSERLLALLDGLLDTLRREAADVLDALDAPELDSAEGWLLDMIGLRLGFIRPSTVSAETEHFGFAGNGLGFGQHPFVSPGGAVFERLPVGDAYYRALLLARSALLRSGPSREDTETVLELLFPGSWSISDVPLAPVVSVSADSARPDFPGIVREHRDELIPRAAGIDLTFAIGRNYRVELEDGAAFRTLVSGAAGTEGFAFPCDGARGSDELSAELRISRSWLRSAQDRTVASDDLQALLAGRDDAISDTALAIDALSASGPSVVGLDSIPPIPGEIARFLLTRGQGGMWYNRRSGSGSLSGDYIVRGEQPEQILLGLYFFAVSWPGIRSALGSRHVRILSRDGSVAVPASLLNPDESGPDLLDYHRLADLGGAWGDAIGSVQPGGTVLFVLG